MGRGDQLHAPLRDSACGGGLLLRAHLVDDDRLGHVVLHGLDHHAVLLGRCRHLHAPGAANGRMGHVTVAGNLIGCVDDDYPFLRFLGEHPGHLAQHGGLANAGPS